MVSRASPCDSNRLRGLLSAPAGEECPADVAAHLEECETCRRQLELLAAEPSWWRKAQASLSLHDLAAPSHDAEAAGSAETGGTRRRGDRQDKSEQLALDFLEPSEDPEKLGRLGPYEVTEIIGRGGAGIVLKAFDPALHRFVAIKVLAAHLASNAAARRRFAREAQAAAAVVHEHVVAIHSVHVTGGQPYLVMQHVAGRSLQERLDQQGPLELREIVRIAMQAASGLAAAHAQGLVHRDVKPANILLEGGVGRVMLTDFGLARTIDDASLTQSGVIAGTPQYMAPEQARGETLDHRADLFSLGSVLYAMCTGHSPFRAETMMGVLRRICEDRPRPVRELNPEISGWLADAIDCLLAKQPAERFATADELAQQLALYLAHLQQPTLYPQPAAARKRRSKRSRLALAAAAAFSVAALACAAAWTGRTAPRGGEGQVQSQSERGQTGFDEPSATGTRRDEQINLAEWNRFEQKLDAARRQTAQFERSLRRSSDRESWAPDTLPPLQAELDALEQRWNQSK